MFVFQDRFFIFFFEKIDFIIVLFKIQKKNKSLKHSFLIK